jgi:replicative DNA helicase
MASDTPDRLPPRSQEAERAILGSMLRDNAIIDDVTNLISADSFYEDGHQKIFQAVVDLRNKPKPIDLVTLGEELLQRKQVEDIGGMPYLYQLWDSTPTAANAVYYAQIVRDRSMVRNLIHASTEILRDAYDQAQAPEEMLAVAERKILEIAEKGTTGKTITLGDAIDEAYARIDSRTHGESMSISGLATDYTDLDEITAGLQNSELILVAARPSIGKTAFALNLVRNIAVDNKHPVFFVSLEQSRIELAERLLCCQARVDSHKLRRGNLSRDDIDKLVEAGGHLRETKLFIDDTPGQSMLRIAANARRLKLREKIRLVVIDYLQLIDPDNRRDPRQEQVAQISRRLKFLARELQIPLIALAQVNRSSEDRQDHRPRLADLRESGSLEQDSDTVMLLHRPDRYEPGQNEGIIEIIIGKQRNGPTGEITLAYIKQYMRFENFAVGTPFES